jgi:hypothetical protein
MPDLSWESWDLSGANLTGNSPLGQDCHSGPGIRQLNQGRSRFASLPTIARLELARFYQSLTWDPIAVIPGGPQIRGFMWAASTPSWHHAINPCLRFNLLEIGCWSGLGTAGSVAGSGRTPLAHIAVVSQRNLPDGDFAAPISDGQGFESLLFANAAQRCRRQFRLDSWWAGPCSPATASSNRSAIQRSNPFTLLHALRPEFRRR